MKKEKRISKEPSHKIRNNLLNKIKEPVTPVK